MGARAKAPIAIVVGLLVALLVAPSAASAADKYGYVFKETFGSAASPSFTQPLAPTVDPATRDLLVVDSSAKTISRFKRNGEPDNFSALASNVIDGKGGLDKTPQEGLSFGSHAQIAVAPPGSAGGTAGNIYVTQEAQKLIDVFSSSGEYLGQITKFTSDEIQKLELAGFAEGDEFSLSGLPGSCSGLSTANVPYSALLGDDVRTALEAQCGPNFAVKATVSVEVEFTGELGHSDLPGLQCSGACSTIINGDATHNEVQKFEFTGYTEGEEFAFSFPAALPTPAPCGKTLGNILFAEDLAQDLRAELEEMCGPNFATAFSATASVTVEFANALSLFDEPQLTCAVDAGAGSCTATTIEAGGQAKPLGRSGGVTVDPAGAVYLGDSDNDLVHKYLPASNSPFEDESTANFFRKRADILVAGSGPTAGYVFANKFGSPEPVKLDSTTGKQEYVVASFSDGAGSNFVALNPSDGTLFSATALEVRQYDASGATEAKRLAHFEPNLGNLSGLAVDPLSGDLYISRNGQAKIAVFERVTLPEAVTEAPTEVSAESATLHGKVSAAAGPPASCEFQYTTQSNSFTEAIGVPCTPNGPFSGSEFEAVSAHVGGLAPGTPYRFRVVATNKGGSTPESKFTVEGSLAFTTLGPRIAEEAISEVSETGAVLSAQLNPNGEETTYAAEYVSQAEFLKSGYNNATLDPATPEAIGSGDKFIAVSIELSGLTPDSAFHVRLTASNPGFTVHGPDLRFATYPVAEGLPDGRAWEKVTPTDKAGEVIATEPNTYLTSACYECLPGGNHPQMPMQAAPDGESVLYEGQAFAEGLASGPNEYVSARSPDGWDWHSLSTPTMTGEWWAFSDDLSRGVLKQTEPPLSPEAPTREGKAFANLYMKEEGGAFQPLLTAAPPKRDPGFDTANRLQIQFAAANAGTGSVSAFTHVAFEANDALTPAVPGIAPKAPEITAGEECSIAPCNLYEWVGGQLRLVNVLPGNAAAAGGAVIGSGRLLNPGSNNYVSDTSHAISDDGRFVFFSSKSLAHVYARIDGQRTLAVAGPASCKEGGEATAERACFLTASTDGKRVLLATGQLDALNEAETAYSQIYDLTLGKGGFQGILGASEDLSRIYFVDTAALTPESEANENGEHAQAGKFNLYAWHEGATSFIGQLAANDGTFALPEFGAWKASPSKRTAQASADGRYLAFMSKAPLTGYDNRHAGGGTCAPRTASGEACFEVFEYDAGAGKLTCASCNPSDLRPLGQSNLSLVAPSLSGLPIPQPANLSLAGEGRLFFESQDVLSLSDKNGAVQDVYGWEPQGVGDCERAGGCVSLISGGEGSDPSLFLDSTPSGDDAFFITRERLLSSDKDAQLDLYDARIGGGFEEEETVPCEGEACKGPVTNPPEAPGAGSPNFVGPGNPTPPAPCPKGKVRRHGKCVKPHTRHRKHGRHRKRAARHNRGARR